MKLKEIEANIKVVGSDGKVLGEVKSKAKYNEPESISEFLAMKDISEADKLRAIQYGLNTIHQTKLRSENELGKAAKLMFEAKLFPSFDAAYRHLVGIKNANEACKGQAA